MTLREFTDEAERDDARGCRRDSNEATLPEGAP